MKRSLAGKKQNRPTTYRCRIISLLNNCSRGRKTRQSPYTSTRYCSKAPTCEHQSSRNHCRSQQRFLVRVQLRTKTRFDGNSNQPTERTPVVTPVPRRSDFCSDHTSVGGIRKYEKRGKREVKKGEKIGQFLESH